MHIGLPRWSDSNIFSVFYSFLIEEKNRNRKSRLCRSIFLFFAQSASGFVAGASCDWDFIYGPNSMNTLNEKQFLCFDCDANLYTLFSSLCRHFNFETKENCPELRIDNAHMSFCAQVRWDSSAGHHPTSSYLIRKYHVTRDGAACHGQMPINPPLVFFESIAKKKKKKREKTNPKTI